MIPKQYDVLLDGQKIGTTELEKADAPMGVVFGKIAFVDTVSGYDFFKTYCTNNKIEMSFCGHNDEGLSMNDLSCVKVVSRDGSEIQGLAVSIFGMDSEGFDVEIIGIPYPFYEIEFPHHVKSYHEQFEAKE